MRVSCVEEDAGRASKKWSRPVGGNRGPRAAPPRLEKGREPIRLERRGSRTTARHREPACIPDSNPARLQRPAPSSDRCDSSECISSRIACSTRKHRSPLQRLEQSEQPAGRDTTPQSVGRLPACRGSAWIESVSSRLRCGVNTPRRTLRADKTTKDRFRRSLGEVRASGLRGYRNCG
jgi:hypothetical protein